MVGQGQEQLRAGFGPSCLDEAEMSGGHPRRQRQLHLTPPAPDPPIADEGSCRCMGHRTTLRPARPEDHYLRGSDEPPIGGTSAGSVGGRHAVGPAYALDVLAQAPMVAFVPVTDIATARTFYESTLGLPVVDDSPYALVVEANGTSVRITPVPELRTQPFTILGWEVADIEETVTELAERGVTFNHYDGMDQSAGGIWMSPTGDRVAWFADPDGNTLSLTQFVDR